MIWYVIENNQPKTPHLIPYLDKGWGNGYVAIPPTHPAYKMDYDTLMYEIDIHGGVTFAGFPNTLNEHKDWWVLGFDTCHYGDTLLKWPKEAVEAETKRLFCQLLEIELGEL